MYVLTYRIK